MFEDSRVQPAEYCSVAAVKVAGQQRDCAGEGGGMFGVSRAGTSSALERELRREQEESRGWGSGESSGPCKGLEGSERLMEPCGDRTAEARSIRGVEAPSRVFVVYEGRYLPGGSQWLAVPHWVAHAVRGWDIGCCRSWRGKSRTAPYESRVMGPGDVETRTEGRRPVMWSIS